MSAASRRSSKGTKQVPLIRKKIRVVERVRSFILAKLVSRIVSKLREAMESRIFRLMRTKGRRLAEKLSHIGQVGGNRSARSWATDQEFIQYLTVSNLSSFGND